MFGPVKIGSGRVFLTGLWKLNAEAASFILQPTIIPKDRYMVYIYISYMYIYRMSQNSILLLFVLPHHHRFKAWKSLYNKKLQLPILWIESLMINPFRLTCSSLIIAIGITPILWIWIPYCSFLANSVVENIFGNESGMMIVNTPPRSCWTQLTGKVGVAFGDTFFRGFFNTA